jgi:hypothetical protein
VEWRFQAGTIWMTQVMIAELFQTTVPNINIHLRNSFLDVYYGCAAINSLAGLPADLPNSSLKAGFREGRAPRAPDFRASQRSALPLPDPFTHYQRRGTKKTSMPRRNWPKMQLLRST